MKIVVCDSFFSKLFGLMFKKDINYGVKIVNCNKLHTFFMFINLDIYMTDENDIVVYKAFNIPHSKIISCRSAKHSFEFKTGTTKYNIGDKITI